MSAPSPSTPAPAACALPASNAEIDASLRLPVFCLFIAGALWLLVASGLGLLASLKLVAPDFLAHCPWLTYGRVKPAAANALVYGFALQAAFGVALWIICRLGRTTLGNPLAVFITSKFWNLGVTLGVFGILAGDSAGHELLEMPGYAWPILFASGALLCASALLALHERRERDLHIAQVYLIAALLWFPWIYSGANVLLYCVPARGVLQAVVGWWFVTNLQFVCLGCFGLAAIFYFIPKLYQSPLPSRDQALIGFWTLLLFGSWCGIPAGAPVPAWMISVSTVAGFLSLVPVLIAFSLWCGVWRASTRRTTILQADPSLLFLGVAVIFFAFGGLRNAVAGARSVSEVMRFTHFVTAQKHLVLYGFFAFAMFGAIYQIVPKLMKQEWPSAGLVRFHFWTGAVGTVLIVFTLSLAGTRTGLALNDATVPFLTAVNGQRTLFLCALFGSVLIAAGNFAMLLNFLQLAARCCRACCGCAGSVCATPDAEVAR